MKHLPMIKECSKTTAIVIIAIWIAGYLGLCFVEWEMFNPIQWVVDLPIATNQERGSYIGLIGSIAACSSIFTAMRLDLDSDHDLPNVPINRPTSLHYTAQESTQQSSLSPSAMDIGLGVAGGIVVGSIIGDILD